MASAVEKFKVAAVAEKIKASADAKNDATPENVIEKAKSLRSVVFSSMGQSSTPKSTPQKVGINKLKTAVAVARLTGVTTPWGNAPYLEKLDIASLSNEKLKRHLTARGELAKGSKKELCERLQNSIEEEKQREIALALELEAKHRRIAGLEEQGAVYVVGKNNMGQLGLGDLEDRHTFTAIPILRGKNVHHVSAGGNMVFATTEQHAVYAWGGSGVGPMGSKSVSKQNSMFKTPQLVESLNGEEIVMTSVGANHAFGASEGGDLFAWGCGQFGVLGTGNTDNSQTAKFVDTFDKTTNIDFVSCGEKHTCIKTRQNNLYSWGHSANGRIGNSASECDKVFNSSPVLVRLPTTEIVRFISCGSEHTLASTISSAYSWGSGDGGRLGHGSNYSDRWEPSEIVALRGSHILDISAGTWHSACIVNIPLMKDSGWLYTWGSGFQGQLGLNEICQTSTPTLLKGLCNGTLSVKRIFCGSYHNAAIASDGNLYTWGSNKHGALGRSNLETEKTFTPNPGIVIEFGTIVNRIGRGLPRSIACGREYTILCSHPYDGPSEEEAIYFNEAKCLREETERERQKALLRAKEDELQRFRDLELERQKIRYLTSKRLCTVDPKCPGFTYATSQPSICRECGFSVAYHTIVVDEPM